MKKHLASDDEEEEEAGLDLDLDEDQDPRRKVLIGQTTLAQYPPFQGFASRAARMVITPALRADVCCCFCI
jgi:hypothetical protein